VVVVACTPTAHSVTLPETFHLAATLQDRSLRFKYLYVKEFCAPGSAPSCTTACADALWSAVVEKREYGQYPLQPVAAYVADMVRLHHHPSSKCLNFTADVRAQVSGVPGCCAAVLLAAKNAAPQLHLCGNLLL
jgi:hypothetical protein